MVTGGNVVVAVDVGHDSIDDDTKESILDDEELLDELNDCLSETTDDKHR